MKGIGENYEEHKQKDKAPEHVPGALHHGYAGQLRGCTR